MDIYQINEKTYYEAKDINNTHRGLVKGCTRYRQFINDLNIPTTEYIFAYNDKYGVLTVCKEKYSRGRLFISQSFIDDLLNKNKEEITMLPDPIKLSKKDYYTKPDGSQIMIRLFGERTPEGLYMSVKDIAEGFETPNLQQVLINKDNNYIKGIDYKIFFNGQKKINYLKKSGRKDNVLSDEKVYMMTYYGFMRFIFVSRVPAVLAVNKWIVEQILTIKHGTKEAKQELANNIMGIGADMETTKTILNKCVGGITSVYFIIIGYAKDIFPDRDYPPNLILCKYGFSKDLKRRCAEHTKKYLKKFGANIEMYLYTNIIDIKLSEAEKDVADALFKYNCLIEGMEEHIIIEEENLKEIETLYTTIQDKYDLSKENVLKQISYSQGVIDTQEKQLKNLNSEVRKMYVEQYKIEKENEHLKEIIDSLTETIKQLNN